MKSRTLALTAAASLALAGATATPVRADQNFNNFLMAAGAIMIIAGATSSARGSGSSGGGSSRTVVVQQSPVAPAPVGPVAMAPHPCPVAPHMAPAPGGCLP